MQRFKFPQIYARVLNWVIRVRPYQFIAPSIIHHPYRISELQFSIESYFCFPRFKLSVINNKTDAHPAMKITAWKIVSWDCLQPSTHIFALHHNFRHYFVNRKNVSVLCFDTKMIPNAERKPATKSFPICCWLIGTAKDITTRE